MSPSNLPAMDAATVPDDAYLLDVREPDEWIAGHAPGAVHIPMGALPSRAGEVPRDRPVVVVCRVGARSAQVTDALNRAGWDAVNLTGGMHAWHAAQRPMVSESGDRPTVA